MIGSVRSLNGGGTETLLKLLVLTLVLRILGIPKSSTTSRPVSSHFQSRHHVFQGRDHRDGGTSRLAVSNHFEGHDDTHRSCLLSTVGVGVIPSARNSDLANELMLATPASVGIMKCPAQKEMHNPRVSRGADVARSTMWATQVNTFNSTPRNHARSTENRF